MTSKRRLREQIYIAEAERNAWHEAWREAVQNQCVCRVDNAPCKPVEDLERLVGRFIERWVDTDGEPMYTVNDHYFLDTEFFPTLFQIIDESKTNERDN